MPEIRIKASLDEREHVELAASLKHITLDEYVKRAINAALIKDGVDSVLFAEHDPFPGYGERTS